MVEDAIRPDDDLAYGLVEMKKALPGYEEAESYYSGDVQEKFISRKLRSMLSGSASDFQVNLAPRVVHAVTDRLEIASLTVTTDEGPQSIDATSVDNSVGSSSGSSETPVEILNERVWIDNELDQEAPDVHLKAGYLGDSYVFMWPNDDNGLDLFMHRPESVRVFYDIENPRVKWFAIHWWVTRDGATRINLWYNDWCVKYVTRSKKVRDIYNPSNYVRFTDEWTDEDGVMENVLGIVPFWHFRTDRPYGVPLHKNAYGPQDGVTKMVKSMTTITDFASFPQRWALGETDAGSDEDFVWDDEDSAPDDLESELTSGPGRVWFLKNVKNVGQFQEANIDQVLKPLEKFIDLMAASTGTPMTYLNKVRGTASTPLSGASQRELEAAHLKKVRAIQRSFGSTWRSLLSFAVEYLGGEEATVNVQWAPAYFRDDKETWEAVKVQQESGVPIRATLMEQGYTEAEVESWGYTEVDPNGPEPDPSDNPFLANQQAPAPQELLENNDGDTSRFNSPEGDDQ